MRHTWLVASVFIAAFGASCTGAAPEDTEGPESAAVRIASFDFAESRLIAELYAQALEGQGVDIVRLGAIGPREVVAPALEQGHIDLVPEYLGTVIEYFTGRADAGTDALTEALRPRGLRTLDAAPAQDVNVFVVTETTAERFDLETISELADVETDLTLGGPVECPDRALCLLGLQATYGLSFTAFEPHRSLAVTAEALVRSEVDVGVMFSTAAELSSGPFVVLADDRALQPAENIVPLVREPTVRRWGRQLVDVLDLVSRHLTTSDLQAMNRRARDGEPVANIASSWLRSVGLAGSP